MSFIKLFKLKITTRQTTLNAVGMNPPQSVPWSRATCGDGNTTTADSEITPGNQNRPQRKRGNEQESADAASVLWQKRFRDGEATNVDKRPFALTRNTTDTSSRTWDSEGNSFSWKRGTKTLGKDSLSHRASWLREGFQFLVTQRGLLTLASELQGSAPPMTKLWLSDPRVGYFLGVGLVHRCIDLDTLKFLSSSGVEDTLGGFGAHLSQVLHFIFIIVRILLFCSFVFLLGSSILYRWLPIPFTYLC